MLEQCLFYAFLNDELIGFFVHDLRYRDRQTIMPIARVFLKAMGFDTFNEYVGSLPGYSINTRLFRWVNSDDTCLERKINDDEVKKSKSKQNFRIVVTERSCCDEHVYMCKQFRSYGSYPFVLPAFREMSRLYEYLDYDYDDVVFSCCSDWSSEPSCENWVERDDYD